MGGAVLADSIQETTQFDDIETVYWDKKSGIGGKPDFFVVVEIF